MEGAPCNLPNNLTLLAGPQPVLDDNRQPRYVAAWELASGTLLGHQQANFPNGMPRDALFSYMEDAAKGLDDYFLIDADPLVHRDFKPENLFLFGHRLKIGDPALMRSVGASFSMTGQIQGTLEYMPHEAMVDGTVSSTFDRYSFIVTYANLRLGRCVFSQGLPAGMLQRIEGIVKRKRELRIDLTGLDPDERELFGQLAHPDYKQRPLDKLTDLLRALGPHAKAAYAAPPAPADQTGGGAHRRVSRGFEGRQQQMPPTPLVEPFTQQQALASRKHWAVHLGIEPEFTVLNDMRFVLLPPAEFVQGSNESDDEKPPRKRRITQPFYLQTTPTTIRQVLKWLEESDQWDDSWIDLDDPCCPINRRRMKYSFRIGNGPFVAPSPDQPMTSISWYGCEAFTQWLSKQHRAKFRLVKEVEWEYAARAGSTGKWCCGNDETQLGEYAWYKKNAGRLTRIVGQKKPNAFGLYDLHGNCWEWCLDWYDATFYANSSIDDPFNAIPASYRVIRGGGSDYSSQLCRSANRHWYSKDSQFHSLGFRVAAVQSGQ